MGKYYSNYTKNKLLGRHLTIQFYRNKDKTSKLLCDKNNTREITWTFLPRKFVLAGDELKFVLYIPSLIRDHPTFFPRTLCFSHFFSN